MKSGGHDFLVFEDRPADCAFVERIWRSHSEHAGVFHSIASPHWEIAVTRHEGRISLNVRGPETRATLADCPAHGEWLGIRFKLGTFMPSFPAGDLRDRRDVSLPEASRRSFWLNGSAWEYPEFENAETFVNRLVRAGALIVDRSVDAALRGQAQRLSVRTEQRRFLRVTGITRNAIRQIERARHATSLLKGGVSIANVACEAGYFDQAHLTRSLKRLIGQTPAQIFRAEQQLSFLYNTNIA